MKTVLEYLREQENVVWHNRLCYSKTYDMDVPKEGKDDDFVESVRDCEIVDYLIELVKCVESRKLTNKIDQSQDEDLPYNDTALEVKLTQGINKMNQLYASICKINKTSRNSVKSREFFQSFYDKVKRELIAKNVLQTKDGKQIFVNENLGDIDLTVCNARNHIIKYFRDTWMED